MLKNFDSFLPADNRGSKNPSKKPSPHGLLIEQSSVGMVLAIIIYGFIFLGDAGILSFPGLLWVAMTGLAIGWSLGKGRLKVMVNLVDEKDRQILQMMDEVLAEEEIKNLSKFPSENPNPVLRISGSGQILYANTTGQAHLKEWKTAVGKTISQDYLALIKRSLSDNVSQNFEDNFKGRSFFFETIPITEAGYVNIYGRATDAR